jgi:hypothetical protein
MGARSDSWSEDRLLLMKQMQGASRGPKAMWEALNKLPGPKLTKSAVIGMRARQYGVVSRRKSEEEKAATLKAGRERDAAKKREKRAADRTPGSVGSEAYGIIHRIKAKTNGTRAPDAPFKPQSDPVDEPKHIGLLDLNTFTCHAVYGDGLSATYCGHMTTLCGPDKERQSPYCRAHHALYYKQPPVKQQRSWIELRRHAA